MANDTIDSLRQDAQKALSQGNAPLARQRYQQAIAFDPDSPDLHYGLATAFFLLNDYSNALHHFKEVVRFDPARSGAYINMGAVYNRLEQYDDAVASLRKGIQLNPNRGEGYYNLGLVYRQLGQLDMAIQAYREATRVNPRMADAHYNIGNIYLEKGQHGMALAHYRQALDLRPNWEKAQRALEHVQALQAGEGGADGPPSAAKSAARPARQQLDPDRLLDPNVHGHLLRDLHQLIIEMDTQGRSLESILVGDVEQTIRALSNTLLLPNSPGANLTEQIQKFEAVMAQLRKLQDGLKKRSEKIEQLGEQIAKL